MIFNTTKVFYFSMTRITLQVLKHFNLMKYLEKFTRGDYLLENERNNESVKEKERIKGVINDKIIKASSEVGEVHHLGQQYGRWRSHITKL